MSDVRLIKKEREREREKSVRWMLGIDGVQIILRAKIIVSAAYEPLDLDSWMIIKLDCMLLTRSEGQ